MEMQIDLRIADTVDVINDSIDQISNDSFFTYGWFKTLEMFGRIPAPQYLVLYFNQRIIAIAPCFIDRTGDFFAHGPKIMPFLHRALNIGKKINLLNEQVLLCYSPSSRRTKILSDPKFNARVVARLILAKIDKICLEKKILFSTFLFVSEFDTALSNELLKSNYTKFDNTLTYYMKIDWKNFNEYLASLKPRMAKKIRREIKKCEQDGIVINEEKLNPKLAEELSQLDANVYTKHHGKTNYQLGSIFFLTLDKHAKDKVRLLVARKDQKIVGFSLSLQHKDVLDVYMYGANYALQTKTSFAYFNLVYYKPIKLAIDEKISKIYYRYLLSKSRLDRGCKPEQTYSYIKCHQKLLGPIVNEGLKNPIYRNLQLKLQKSK